MPVLWPAVPPAASDGASFALLSAAVLGITSAAAAAGLGYGAPQRVPVAFPARPSPIYPGISGMDWGGTAAGPSSGRHRVATAAAAAGAAAAWCAPAFDDGRDAYNSDVYTQVRNLHPHSSSSSSKDRKAHRLARNLNAHAIASAGAASDVWPSPTVLLRSFPSLLCDTLSTLRVLGGDGERILRGNSTTGTAPVAATTETASARDRMPSATSSSRSASARLRILRSAAADAASPDSPPPVCLRDIPYVEILEMGTGVVAAAAAAADNDNDNEDEHAVSGVVARLRAVLRRTLAAHILDPPLAACEGTRRYPGDTTPSAADASRSGSGALEVVAAMKEAALGAQVEAARQRMGDMAWDNRLAVGTCTGSSVGRVSAAASGSPPGVVAAALSDPGVLSRLLRLSFAELRGPTVDSEGREEGKSGTRPMRMPPRPLAAASGLLVGAVKGSVPSTGRASASGAAAAAATLDVYPAQALDDEGCASALDMSAAPVPPKRKPRGRNATLARVRGSPTS